jgi:hypothetical protein
VVEVKNNHLVEGDRLLKLTPMILPEFQKGRQIKQKIDESKQTQQQLQVLYGIRLSKV